MKNSMTRREFLSTACRCGAVLAAGGAVLSIPGCGEKVEPYPTTLSRVREIHKRLGGLPDNPVAVAQSNAPVMYPDIGYPTGYDRAGNPCYPLVEEALMLLNPDEPENPLCNIVRPGDTVVIKPNWCTQYIFPIPITHPSLVHPVAELAAKAGAAKVRIVEAPMTMAHSATWFYGPTYLNIKPWLEYLAGKYPKTVFEHKDGNADDFTWVTLGDRSLLKDMPREVLYHDNGPVLDDMFYDVPDSRGFDPRGYRIGLYAIANSYLDCDVFINFPKMKTHIWTGVTIALKNMMGLNLISTIHKMPEERVEEYMARDDPSKAREAGMRDVPHFDGRRYPPDKRFLGATTNDVLWRSLCDLNRILLYCDAGGRLHDNRQRRRLNIVDGIIGTDGDGPIKDARVHSSTIVAGEDPVRVDAVCTRLMGYEPSSMILIRNSGALTSELPIGSLAGYEESIVSSASPGRLPKVYIFKPPTVWGSDDKINIWHRKS